MKFASIIAATLSVGSVFAAPAPIVESKVSELLNTVSSLKTTVKSELAVIS
jgi:hypothetical protein